LNSVDFYSYITTVDYIKQYNPKIKLKEKDLSLIHNKVNECNLRRLPVQKSKVTEDFITYVKDKFPDFDVDALGKT
jgi:hypothetical protein